MGVTGSFFHRLGILASLGLSMPVFAAAQHHAGGMASGPAVGHAGTVVMHAVPVGHVAGGYAPRAVQIQGRAGSVVRGGSGRAHTGVRNVPRTNNFNRGFDNSNRGFDDTNFNDVPGLGFDFPHLAAVSGNRHHGRGFFGGVPFFDGGVLFGSPSVIVEQPAAEEQSPEDDANAGNGAESDPPRRSRRTYDAEASPAPAAAAQPVPDVEQYVFVKRDGGLEFAVAYSWDNQTLRYITPDGKRRTMRSDALDLSATEQFNEQRGVEFHAPA